MSHPASPGPETPRRPATVTTAAAILIGLAAGGLAYAVATLAVLPGVADRLQTAGSGAGASPAQVSGFVAVLWTWAIVAGVVAVVLAVVLVLLARGVRRGSSAARVGAWVVCGLGLLCGAGAVSAVVAQRNSSFALPGTGLGRALTDAYPAAWIWINTGVAAAQTLGYLLAAGLLMLPGSTAFFRSAGGRGSAAGAAGSGGWQQPAGWPQPGPHLGTASGWPQPAVPSGWGPAPQPGGGQPGGGPPVSRPGWGPPAAQPPQPPPDSAPPTDPRSWQRPEGWRPPNP